MKKFKALNSEELLLAVAVVKQDAVEKSQIVLKLLEWER